MVGLLITPHLHVLYHRYIIILRLHSLLLMCRTISTPSRPGMLSPDPSIILRFRMTLFALLFKPFLNGVPRRDGSLWISNSYLCVLNNRLPRLARYLQAVFIVTNSFEVLINLKLETWTYNSRPLLGKWFRETLNHYQSCTLLIDSHMRNLH